MRASNLRTIGFALTIVSRSEARFCSSAKLHQDKIAKQESKSRRQLLLPGNQQCLRAKN
jgi:hypothetical protein